MVHRAGVWIGIFVSAVAVGGCQPSAKWDLVTVQGSVAQAGRPLAGVEVIFWPDAGSNGPRASGFTNAAGRYELKTDAGGRGAAPGMYRVCILASRDEPEAEEKALRLRFASRRAKARKSTPASSQPKEKQDSRTAPTLLPKEYSQFEKTPLRAEVKRGGGQTIDFTIP